MVLFVTTFVNKLGYIPTINRWRTYITFKLTAERRTTNLISLTILQ